MYLFLSPAIWWVKRQWIDSSVKNGVWEPVFASVSYLSKTLTGSEKKTESVLKYEKVFLRYPEVYTAKLTLQKCVGHQLKYETKLTLVAINHCNEEKQILTRLTSR